MNEKYFKIIIDKLDPFFESQSMKRISEDEFVYSNSKKAVKIYYDQDRKVFKLDLADLAEGESVDFNNVSAYLFDEGHNEKDAASVASDFLDTLNTEFGITKSYITKSNKVNMPSKAAQGATPNIEAFTNRFLTLYPLFKDAYKKNVTDYGEFMFDDFYTKTAAVKIKEIINSGNEKDIKKMLEMLDEYYVDGDNTVQGIITYSILGESFRNDNDYYLKAAEQIKNYAPHLVQASAAMYRSVILKNK